MALTSSTKSYHIGRNGKPARCKAGAGQCPLGGQHFANKAIADFYVDTQVDLASVKSVKTIMHEMANEHLEARLKAVVILSRAKQFGDVSMARSQERKMRKMFNGYTPEDKTWDEATLRDEKARRTKLAEEREWNAIIEGHKAVEKMTVDQIDFRLLKLQPLRTAIERHDDEGGRRYASMLKSKYGFDVDDQSWNPMVLEGERDARVKDYQRSLGIRDASTSQAHSPEQSRY
jgi:hypothetical protein